MTGPEAAPRLDLVRRLGADEIDAVTLLLERVTEVDGVRPVSEHAMLQLRHGGDPGVQHLLLWDNQLLVGYLDLDVTDEVEGASAELAVRPDQRNRGLGRQLVERAIAQSPGGRLRLWAHGEQPAASALATSMGFSRVRALWQMRRSLGDPIPAPALPADVVVRTFVPGQDDEAWVALNAVAFADHAEQGSWSIDDLQRRQHEPWFDPAGFFLAERDGELIGFHWTKVHSAARDAGAGAGSTDHGHEALGEVYVLGVHPNAHGLGLGKALTLVGLRHLRNLGLSTVMLYVDADNQAAVGLYTSLGFTRWTTDVMFSHNPT